MKRSKQVLVPLVSALAAFIVGCNEPEPVAEAQRVCIDPNTKQVQDAKKCEEQDRLRASGSVQHSGGMSPFMWYYLGSMNSRTYYPVGAYAPSGGSYVRPVVHSGGGGGFWHGSSTTSRGGFGSTGSGHFSAGA